MYPLYTGLSFTEAKLLGLRVLLTDKAACHCAIAAMAACNDLFQSVNSSSRSSRSSSSSSPAGLYHLGQTLAMINKRLSSEDALSNSSLGIIVMLIIQEQIRNDHNIAAVHYDRLCRIIALRGGLGQLEHNMPLVLKIRKMDISYALQFGRPLVFHRDRIDDTQLLLLSKRIPVHATGRENDHVSPLQTARLDPYLAYVVDDVASITTLLRDAAVSGTALDALSFQNMATSIFSRLIRFGSPQFCSGRNAVDAEDTACHVGLILYMITVCLRCDCRRVVEYTLVSERLRNVVCSNEKGPPELDDGLVLWLLFIGGIWASGGDNADNISWYVSRIRALAEKLGLMSWEEAHIAVSAYPWLEAVHAGRGHALWDKGQ